MNYYEHHLGDWAKKCCHLSLTEEGAYRRLLDWYYSNERPLPTDIDEVQRIARSKGLVERRAVTTVLKEFFEPMEDGWHQARVDRELESFSQRLPVTLQAKESQKLRSERARAKRSALFKLLDENGIDAPWNATNNALYEALHENGIEVPRTVPRTAPETTCDAPCPANQAPSTKHHEGFSGKPLAVIVEVEARAEAARAMKKVGFTSVNPLDPRFLALLADGCTPDEMRLVAAEAAVKGKGWAWLLATLKGRREDAKRAMSPQGDLPQQAPKTARQRADEARLREWAPQLLQTPSGG